MPKTRKPPVAAVMLYGTSRAGFNFLVDLGPGRIFGEGGTNLRQDWSATDALWLGLQMAQTKLAQSLPGIPAIAKGRVAIHCDLVVGPRVAYVALDGGWPYFGDLKWETGEMVTLSSDDVLAAAR